MTAEGLLVGPLVGVPVGDGLGIELVLLIIAIDGGADDEDATGFMLDDIVGLADELMIDPVVGFERVGLSVAGVVIVLKGEILCVVAVVES